MALIAVMGGGVLGERWRFWGSDVVCRAYECGPREHASILVYRTTAPSLFVRLP